MMKSAIACLGIGLLLAAEGWAQPEEPRQDVVRAEAPIVAGNAVNAKKLAITSALRQAAEQSYADIIKEGAPIPSPPPPAIAQLRASLASAPQRYVRSYRLIEQQTEGGMVRVMVEVDVDTVALRRAIDRALGTATVNLLPTNQPATNLIYIAGPAPAASLLAAGFGTLGIRARLDPSPTEAQLLANAAKEHARAIYVVAQSKAEEGLRGAFRVPVKCSLGWRLFGADLQATHGPVAARTDRDYGFGKDEAAARDACFASVAQTVVRDAAAAIRAPVTSLPFVTLKLDIPDVGAVPIVLRALKRLGTSAANEVRHVTANAAEIRVFTRTSGPMLQQALARELGGKLSFEPVQTSLDQIVAKVRGADTPPVEENR
jgi:hypothetical protein